METRGKGTGAMIVEKPWSLAGGHLGPALRECLTAAAAAPSVHNTQPWLFRPFVGGVDVYADQTRRLHVLDASGRELMISVGAALLNLRVAMLAHGRTPICRLLPDPAQPNLVARVHIGARSRVSDTVRLLAGAIPRRHTIRHPFTSDHLPDEVFHELRQAAAVEGGYLARTDDVTRAAVLSLVRQAERAMRIDPEYWRELHEWTEQRRGRTDGVPVSAYGPWSAMEAMPVRDFGLLEPTGRRVVAVFEEEPEIAVLYSDGDGPAQWLRTGEALERTLLTACVRGVAATLMTQPIELPGLRALLEDTANGRRPQAVLRFGYGPMGMPTPRRPLDDVLVW